MLFAQKKSKGLSFETIAEALGRDEVAAAALFYGQAKASEDDIKALSKLLDIPESTLLATEITAWPDRGRATDMPPKEPLIYRFYELVQNYGYAWKAVLNEKFGDGIMSAISFSMHIEKEVDDKGAEWVNIKMRGKWLVFEMVWLYIHDQADRLQATVYAILDLCRCVNSWVCTSSGLLDGLETSAP